MNKKFFVAALSTLALSVCAVGIIKNASLTQKMEKIYADTYTFTLDENNSLPVGSGTQAIENSAHWEINFGYDSVTSNTDCFAVLEDGEFYNLDPIHSMESIIVNYTGTGSINMVYGFGLVSDIGEQRVFDNEDRTALSNGTEFDFNDELPSYFDLLINDTVTISEIIIKYSCAPGDNRDMGDNYNLTFSNGEFALQTPGYFRYWAGRSEWNSSQVTFYGGIYENNSVSFDYGVSGNDSDWGLQLLYKNPNLTAGNVYELSFDINIPGPKTIKLNGQSVALTAGDNKVAIEYTESADALSLEAIIPTSALDGSNVSILITNLKWDAISGRVGIQNGDENSAINNPGEYREWHDAANWCGAVVAVEKSYVSADDSITLQYSCSYGACTFGFQLFYKNASLTNGATYTLTLDVEAANACDIYLQETSPASNMRSLSAGSNTISITYTETAGNASLSFIVPVVNGSANTFVLSNIVWTPAE